MALGHYRLEEGLQSQGIGQLSPVFGVSRDQKSSDLVKVIQTIPQDFRSAGRCDVNVF